MSVATPPPHRLYFDNAATSFPKPSVVTTAMHRYAEEIGASPGRGGYAEAIRAGDLLYECRDRLNTLLHGESPDHVVFTLNTTDALNLAIRGVAQHHLSRGEAIHIVTTEMDHNSVLRPLNALRDSGVEHSRVQADSRTGQVDPHDVANAIRCDTRLVAVIHGSNVSGTLQDVESIGRICREREVTFLVDAAQTLGHLPVDVQRQCIDLLAFPGHKGLLGPLGTGGLYIRPGVENIVATTREGGTGSISESDVQPNFMPDRFESGSHNTIGIAGLSAAVGWILHRGIDSLWAHEQRLMAQMLDGIDADAVNLLGPRDLHHRCGVFAMAPHDITPEHFSQVLEEGHSVLSRSGLHCAPGAHATFKTHERGGATRLSLGPYLSEADVQQATQAVMEVVAATVPANV